MVTVFLILSAQTLSPFWLFKFSQIVPNPSTVILDESIVVIGKFEESVIENTCLVEKIVMFCGLFCCCTNYYTISTLIYKYAVIWLVSLNPKLSFRGRGADWTLNEAPGFERHNKNTELEQGFQAIHHSPSINRFGKCKGRLVIRTKEANANPCYPACSMRSLEGGDEFLEEWR